MQKQSKSSAFVQNLLGYSSSPYKWEILWKRTIQLIVIHAMASYGLYLLLFKTKFSILIWYFVLSFLNGLGVTAGAHRLWSHRSYKAQPALQILLLFLNCLSYQYSVLNWAKQHRLHHKFAETDADPHNSKRGFFFSHMGWLMVDSHPEYCERYKQMDYTDLDENVYVRFQDRYYVTLSILIALILPFAVTYYVLDGTAEVSFFVTIILRLVFGFHATWCVNSFAHMHGQKPYDRFIAPVENKIVSFITYGEGYHNFHHVFPWDYRTAESVFSSSTTTAIHLWQYLGWAYDLKCASDSMVQARIERTGNKQHSEYIKRD